MYTGFEIITTGFALFAMLFGAGNLIFPPILGYNLSNGWSIASFAFILTGVGIPFLGIIAASRTGKSLDTFTEKVSPIFSRIYSILLLVSIGPLLALPRTGATAYEVTFFQYGQASPILKYVYLAVYFAVALFFSIKPTKVVDRIGKILTPVLLLVLFIILFKGVFFNGTPIPEKVFELPFKTGFVEGYQTMDGLASIVFAGVILQSIRNGKNLSKKQEFSFLIKSSLIAMIGLVIVYAGLAYIGATFGNTPLVQGAERTDLLVKIATTLLGKAGFIVLAICVAGACLTTSIGLIVTFAQYFSDLLKISYEKMAILTALAGFLFAIFGVNTIVIISVPILVFLYPMSMALIIIHALGIENKYVQKGAVLVTGVIGLYEAFMAMGIKLPEAISNVYSVLPFSNLGLSWVIPTIVVGILCFFKKEK